MTWRVVSMLRRLECVTRPVDGDFAAAMRRRWDDLPPHVKTPGQVLGRHGVGCEGTHGVFPKCNLACTPCYHSRDANQVRVDGGHTVANVEAQMALLRRVRGPRAHAQLIGGEVSLLDPDDHAAALAAMRQHGREPMSFTHGDVDYAYLRRLALGPDGKRRFDRLSFAAHFDMFMFGRRGIARPGDERSLNRYRAEFTAKLRRLRAETGVRTFAAHNMTVTPANLDQVADVVRDSSGMGFGMFSFQPAAFVGDSRRWHEDYRDVDSDAVWEQIERGVGTKLDYRIFEHGDVRCNRVAYGFWVGDRWFPVLDGADRRDLAVRDGFFRHLGAFDFAGTPVPQLAAQLTRVAVRRPQTVVLAVGWLVRAVRRVGIRRLARCRRVRITSYVMHRFMDAADVTTAWDLMQRGQSSDDPRIRETVERLSACHYAMAHPEDGTVVPACVQHSVLDPGENAQLRRLLPIVQVRTGGREDATTMERPTCE
ncbi:MAG: radical SAM domain-containing protein [Catenulispora sp.]|nr:radical SAM domain-containing protein [Catenulispora sp.]NUR60259.1 radical SAM domain-containing protein [Catenulispora sp.]